MLKKIVSKAFRILHNKNSLIFFKIDKGKIFSPASMPAIPLRITTIEGLLRTGVTRDAMYARAIKELKAQSTVYIVILDERIAHFSCVSSQSVFTFEIVARIKSFPAPYIYNCMTATQYRGRGLYYATLLRIIHDCKSSELIITCLSNNHGSLAVINKLEPVVLGRCSSTQTLGLRSRTIDDSVRKYICF